MIFRIPRWLTYSFHPLYLNKIQHIYGVEGDELEPSSNLYFDPRSVLLGDENTLFRLSSCLIRAVPDSRTDKMRVELAHLSVH